MRKLLVALSCAFCSIVAAAATPDDALRAPIHQFIDGFNNGDTEKAAAAYAAGGVQIIDEVPPYLWQGTDAFTSWAGDLGKDAAKNGVTNAWVTLGDTARQEIDGDNAYVIVDAVYTFKLNGAPMRENAQMTFALRKQDDGWRIAGWTWTSPPPQSAQ